jgi:predicted ATPase/DNA-binding SARP family transcriptional activator
LEFRILGLVEVVDEERSLVLGGPKPRALLAHLVIEAGRPVSRERLIDELWGDDPPATVQDSLNVHVAKLRQAVGTRLRTTSSGYVLDALPVEIDAVRFEERLSAARSQRDDPASIAPALADALAIWRGPVFGGLAVGPTAAAAGARLEELRAAALEARVEADLALGRHADLIGELMGLVAASPTRERLAGQLMLALHRCERDADALSVFASTSDALQRNLGVDPGDELTALQRAIHRGDPTLGTPGPESLPVSASHFVGRRLELAQTYALLTNSRVLTLAGPGGSGKSRLAVELARSLTSVHPGGTYFIDLAPLTATASVSREVAATIGVRERQGEPLPKLLARWLRHRRCLLVFDNCEHLVESCAALSSTLLETAPGLRILATSREPLGVRGEVVYAVPGLSLPSPSDPIASIESSDAVRLLMDRAAAARSGFALTPEDAQLAAAVCRKLDGLPLAIELAAERLRTVSLRELLAWLDERLDSLGETRGVQARHRTMRAAIQWSYELLDEQERAAFRRFSVFAGSFDADAGSAVATGWAPLSGPVDMRGLCDRLANKSMLVAEPGSERARYRMLEVVRQFGSDCAIDTGEDHRAHSLHATWYHDSIPEPQVWAGQDQASWMERLGRDVDNVRAAMTWLLAGGEDPQRALEMVGRLWWFWYMRGMLGEGGAWFQQVLAATPSDPTPARGIALRGAAATARILGDFGEALRLGAESLVAFRALDDDRGVAAALNNLCITAMMSGDLQAAKRFGEEGLLVVEGVKESQGLASAQNNLGMVVRNLGDAGRAAELFASARAGYAGGGNQRGLAAAFTNLAILGRQTGDATHARENGMEALRLYTALGFDEGKLDCLEVLGALEADAGNAESALRMMCVAGRRREELAAPLFVPDEVTQVAQAERTATTALGTTATARVVAGARDMTVDELVARLLADDLSV